MSLSPASTDADEPCFTPPPHAHASADGRVRMRVDVEIREVREEAGYALAEGIAYPALVPIDGKVAAADAFRIDSYATWMSPETLQRFAHRFLERGTGGVDSQHDHGTVGCIVESYYNREATTRYPANVWVVTAKAIKADAIEGLVSKRLKGFSIEFTGKYKDAPLVVEGIGKVRTAEIVEPYPLTLSLVDRPATRLPFVAVEARREPDPAASLPTPEGPDATARQGSTLLVRFDPPPTAAPRTEESVPPMSTAAAPTNPPLAADATRAEPPTPGTQKQEPALRSHAPMFDVGARVGLTVPPHTEGHGEGVVREAVQTYAYGIVFDGMESMGIHHWYVESELKAAADAATTESTVMSASRTAAPVVLTPVEKRAALRAEFRAFVERVLTGEAEARSDTSATRASVDWTDLASILTAYEPRWDFSDAVQRLLYAASSVFWECYYAGLDDKALAEKVRKLASDVSAAMLEECDELAAGGDDAARAARAAAKVVTDTGAIVASRAGKKLSAASRATIQAAHDAADGCRATLRALLDETTDAPAEDETQANAAPAVDPAVAARAALDAELVKVRADLATQTQLATDAATKLAAETTARAAAEKRVAELEGARPAPKSTTDGPVPGARTTVTGEAPVAPAWGLNLRRYAPGASASAPAAPVADDPDA